MLDAAYSLHGERLAVSVQLAGSGDNEIQVSPPDLQLQAVSVLNSLTQSLTVQKSKSFVLSFSGVIS